MRTTRLTRGLFVVGIGVLAAIPFLPINTFWVFFLTITLIEVILLASLNLALGYTGLFSLGHNALYAIGGYATAYLTVNAGWPVGIGIVMGILFGVVAGVVLAVTTYRTRAVYFAIITLAFLFLTQEALQNTPALGGFRGFPFVPGLSWSGTPFSRNAYYWFALGAFVLAMGALQQLLSSGLGRSFMAVRENEAAAASLGIGLFGTKLTALGVSGGLAGLAGALLAHLQGGIFPQTADFITGLRLFVALIVGGIGTFAGPIVGVAVVATLDRLLVDFVTLRPLILAALLPVSLMLLRFGVVGSILRGRFGRFFLRVPSLTDELSREASTPISELLDRGDVGTADGPLLEVHGLSKRFGGVQALDDVDLAVEPGSIHGLIGPNGSGKSTLVNLVSGSILRDAGRITFAGREIAHPKPHVMARLGLVRIFQRAETFERLLVVQSILTGLHLRADRNLLRCMLPLPGRRRRERALVAESLAILSAAGLTHRALDPVAGLPYGEQRLLEIARAVAARPRLLILDEPATGLTSGELERLAELLEALKRAGLTVLVIEHNMEFLMGLVDRVTVLDSGRRISEGEPEGVQNDPLVVEAYLGEPVVA